MSLLAGAVASPETPLAELPLLSEDERIQVLETWNRTAADFPGEATVHGLFAEQAARTPDTVAVIHGDARLTYGELARRSERLARRLLALGVGPEERIGLCAGRSLEMITALLGILKAGAAYLPLDPSSPPERLAWMLSDAGATVLLTDAADVSGNLRVLRLEDLDESESHPEGEERAGRIWAGEPSAPPDPSARSSLQDDSGGPLPEIPAASLAYVMYTSGSTGRPKGVAVTHRNVVRLVRGADYADMGPEQTWLQFAPVSFDAATLEIWAPLLNGGRLVLFPGEKPSLDELGRAIGRFGVTSLWLTAGLFHQMVDHELESLRPLRQLLAGGDVVSPVHARRVLAALPGLTLIDGYGPTEGTTFTCTWRMTDPGQVGAAVPIGWPIANARAYVLDGRIQPVPVGVAGELCIGGEGLSRGYLGRPDLTAERFVPSSWGAPGERLYRTGDRVRFRPDGALEFLGRLAGDGQVKIRGFRVETGEVEAALASLPEVRSAAVLAREDGTGKALTAYVVPAAGESADGLTARLQRVLRERLPEPMIPAAWVLLDALPLTPNGKVDRRALPLPAEDGRRAVYEAPRTPLEQEIVATCADLLGLDPDRIGIRDSFFDLGGHSLLATQLIARLHDRLGIEIPLRLLFDTPDLEAFAERITEQEIAAAGSEDLSALLDEMDGLSPEELRELLSEAGE
jgi:aspartate racemase